MTYWALNAIFLAIVAVVAIVAARRVRWAAVGITASVLLVMTAVFDNIMIGVGLVAYDPARISGAFIGIAPLEDFAYAIAAIIGLPSLWHLLAGRRGAVAAAAGAASADGPDANGPAADPGANA